MTEIPPNTTTTEDFYNPERIFDIDLVAYYQILKARLGCNKLKADYAKSMTKNKFKQIINSMNFGINKLNLYLYLISYKWLFNLDIPVFQPNINLTGDYQLNPLDPDNYIYNHLDEAISQLI